MGWVGVVAQVVEHLPSTLEAPNSNPTTTKKPTNQTKPQLQCSRSRVHPAILYFLQAPK
jgi:hypothetical protein